MTWLDPNSVPTLGDWFRGRGYQTHYRGKWHVSHADLVIPGTHEGLMATDDAGKPIPEAIEAYKKADRLDPFGFSGWIGREPHGAAKSDCGMVRDGVFAEQVVELFGELARARSDGPWLAVASFVNPHDIAFNGFGWDQLLGFGPPDDSVPEIPEAPSQGDSFAGRPPCQEAFKAVWPKMIFESDTDLAYRRLYYYLHKAVDQAIGRILEALRASGHVRRHDHRVHLGPRRPRRRPWRSGPEVVQRLRRGRRVSRCWYRDRAWTGSTAGSRRPRATSTSSRRSSASPGSTSSGRSPVSRPTTKKRTPCPVGT